MGLLQFYLQQPHFCGIIHFLRPPPNRVRIEETRPTTYNSIPVSLYEDFRVNVKDVFKDIMTP